MARTKSAVLTPPSYNEVQTLLGRYAELDAKQVEKQAQLDQKITVLRDKAAPEINSIVEQKKEMLTKIQLFAETNREKYFSKKKSLDLQHGIVGFRVGTPKLKGVPRGAKLLGLLNYFKSYLPGYIRTKTELDKEKILADRNKEEVQNHLKVKGLKVAQTETFFIELKKEESEA